MASQPRKNTFDPGVVNIMHCYARFVRQLFLCSQDFDKDPDCLPRRLWVQDMLSKMARVFAIDIGFVADMTNHVHMVIRNRPDIVQDWTDEEVIRRWVQISHLTKNRKGKLINPTPKQIAKEESRCRQDPKRIEVLRRRLADPSEFMKCLNENIARRINEADGTTGHVWEERFEAKPILGEAAALAVALYVDLNPLRAGEVEYIEDSPFTSAYLRMCQLVGMELPEGDACDELLRRAHAWASANPVADESTSEESTGEESLASGNVEESTVTVSAATDSSAGTSLSDVAEAAGKAKSDPCKQPRPWLGWLSPIELKPTNGPTEGDASPMWRASHKGWFDLSTVEYLSLLDWVARELRADKVGATPSEAPPLFLRIGLRPEAFLQMVGGFRKLFRQAIGSCTELEAYASKRGRKPADLAMAKHLFSA